MEEKAEVNYWEQKKQREAETKVNVLKFIDEVLEDEVTKKSPAMVRAIAELLDRVCK